MSTPAPATWNGPYLYALTQERPCSGDRETCHWCGNPCEAVNRHDEPPPVTGVKSRSTAKKPNSAYICKGCWLWRRSSITVPFLDGKSWQDRESPLRHSWWLQETEPALAIRLPSALHSSSPDVQKLYEHLLHPPAQEAFCLLLTTSGYQGNLHQAKVNHSSSGFTTSSPIAFTLNNVEHRYTVYELQEALRTGKNGKEPGVRILLETLGPPPSGMVKLEKPTAGAPEEGGKVLRQKV